MNLYGGLESSTHCNLRKHMQIDKTQANWENIINLTAHATLQIQKRAANTEDTEYVSRGHQKVLNMAWTHLLLPRFVTHEVAEVWSMYHLFMCMLWFSDFCRCSILCMR